MLTRLGSRILVSCIHRCRVLDPLVLLFTLIINEMKLILPLSFILYYLTIFIRQLLIKFYSPLLKCPRRKSSTSKNGSKIRSP